MPGMLLLLSSCSSDSVALQHHGFFSIWAAGFATNAEA